MAYSPIPLPKSLPAGGPGPSYSGPPQGAPLGASRPSSGQYAGAGGIPTYAQGWPAQGQSNADWLTDAYQTYLGRAPDQQGYDYWLGRMNDGASPSAVAESMRSPPEVLVNSLYGSFLGRKPDQEGFQHYSDMIQQPNGHDTARNEIMNSVEARNYLLGDGYRDYARAATAGMNQLPYVYSDYTATVPGYRNVPKSPFEAMFGAGDSAGQNTINNVRGLLESIFAPKQDDQPAVDEDANGGRTKDKRNRSGGSDEVLVDGKTPDWVYGIRRMDGR